MAKHGQLTSIVAAEIKEFASGSLSYGKYGKQYCGKRAKVHVAVHDTLHTPAVQETTKRCTCGGWTFTSIWGGDKMVCRHCGHQYFKREFNALEESPLSSAEFHDRRIIGMLLSGGDLREDREKNVLVLKNAIGVREGELPLAYADHLANVYKDVRVVKSVRSDTVKEHAITLHNAAVAMG